MNVHFDVITSAWNAAMSLLDHHGDSKEDIGIATERFLKRRACAGHSRDECEKEFVNALRVARAAILFRRAKTGQLPPSPVRRYELLLQFARELATECPEANDYTMMAGCRTVEMYWDR